VRRKSKRIPSPRTCTGGWLMGDFVVVQEPEKASSSSLLTWILAGYVAAIGYTYVHDLISYVEIYPVEECCTCPGGDRAL